MKKADISAFFLFKSWACDVVVEIAMPKMVKWPLRLKTIASVKDIR
ncbi:hypothetical protein [Aquitalea sp.]|nr:hypothetical protein [Aquitalea sp.]